MTAKLGGQFEMPTPQPEDDEMLTVTRLGDDHLVIIVGRQRLCISEYTAAQIVGLMSLFLNLRLQKKDAEALKLWRRDPMLGPELPPADAEIGG